MVNVTPGRMLPARGVVKFVAEKPVLAVKQKMQQRADDSENPYPAPERRAFACWLGIGRLCDYCTFFGVAGALWSGAAAAGASTIAAETM